MRSIKPKEISGNRARRFAEGLIPYLVAGLCCGAAAVQAEQTSAPQLLPLEVIGVVGSGDRLSLQVRQDGGLRRVQIDDEYRDGWRLQALTNTVATLVKDGVTQQIGLNPTGALTQTTPDGPGPRIVRVGVSPTVQAILDMSAEELLSQANAQDRIRFQAGEYGVLKGAEVQRWVLNNVRANLILRELTTAEVARQLAAGATIVRPGITMANVVEILGPAFVELDYKYRLGAYEQTLAAQQAARSAGVTSVTVPRGTTAVAAFGAAGLATTMGFSPAAFSPESNTYVLGPPPTPPVRLDQPQPPPMPAPWTPLAPASGVTLRTVPTP